ncbi:MAG: hypothetical protein HWQ38_07995 [Nostoc sp. NMS7]|uniref:hypothetical protein n=1 Tax=Nostoc sp. NMS7 TaxID=2815391 RepID=UPI0025D3ABE7|nr:hypothetical protein [Nostoc sp. NMS7]MBN3946423.1 hypothetical protein [Nostoc sp. NMS7]
MPTNLNNISAIANNTPSQIYQVPSGVASVILKVAIASVVAQNIQIFLTKQEIDNTFITLIPGKQILATNPDVYSPPLEKLVLLSGQKVFIQATTIKKVRGTGIFGTPCYFDPLQPLPPSAIAHISLSVAEKS